MQQTGISNRATVGRLGFLDWTRGFAVLIILQGHVFHSFSTPSGRNDGPYVISQFFGGIAPAIFLLLTGVTLGFIMARGDRDGLSLRERWFTALRRSRYLFLIAFLFRIQLWVFGFPSSPTSELLRVDVLNCMGFAFAVISPLALLATAERARAAAILGVVIAAGAPIISMLDWNWLHPRIAAYIVPSLTQFGFFPWAAFIAFGLSLGSILRLTKPDDLSRLMQWVALAGFGMLLLGQYCSASPYSIYPRQDFWLNSPWMIAMKLGPILLLLSAAYLWNEYGSQSWSPLRQFGVTSLLVYWVHIELVYGRWFWFLKDSLTAAQCAFCAAILIALMLGLSVLRTRYKGRSFRLFSFSFPYFTAAQPRRVASD
jgi:uncharacterized membrane protein